MYFLLILFLCRINNVIGPISDGPPVIIEEVQDRGPDIDTSLYDNDGHALQWHVGIYTKRTTPYHQICGATLVTTNTVISAAHCFWSFEGPSPAEEYAIGAGKLYRRWSDSRDTYSQTSDVSAIHLPPRFHGEATNFQDDIAVVQLTQTLITTLAVFPACISFDEDMDEEQLASGKPGTVMGWGLTQQDGEPSQDLKYVELPPVPLDKCYKEIRPDFIPYITSDKICAGIAGQALCRGDSGGGLVFIEDSSPPVPYLRGIASTAPRNEHHCNVAAISAFTHVFYHRAFLKKHVPQLERDCQHRYPPARVEYKKSCPNTTHTRISGTIVSCDCYLN